jgi:hypothetical protein
MRDGLFLRLPRYFLTLLLLLLLLLPTSINAVAAVAAPPTSTGSWDTVKDGGGGGGGDGMSLFNAAMGLRLEWLDLLVDDDDAADGLLPRLLVFDVVGGDGGDGGWGFVFLLCFVLLLADDVVWAPPRFDFFFWLGWLPLSEI